jgi:beta-glucosidase-like glycosyl hydrolase
MVPHLNGEEIESRFDYYLGLVRKDIAGFIVFGGELETLREGIKRLQEEADTPLLIMSDLERGLGQQVKGGTLFPPAMALGTAGDVGLVRAAFDQMAQEAAYAGINTILAPVLDINTNPQNPIISIRAFGENPEIVSALGSEMIKSIQNAGLMACGKHFPGHGDTGIDSHIGLPRIDRSLEELESRELAPFRSAIKEGVRMIMLGHLSVPALDPSGTPMTISKEAVSLLRNSMGFEGLITTDAMDMGAIGTYTEEYASLMALRAGVDILLHPSDPEGLAHSLDNLEEDINPERLVDLSKTLIRELPQTRPLFDASVAYCLTEKSIRVDGPLKPLKNPCIILLNDDDAEKGTAFFEEMEKEFPSLRHVSINARWQAESLILPEESELIVCVFSSVKAYKGGTAQWIMETLEVFQERNAILISFGSPYLIDGLEDCLGVYAWCDSETAQIAAAKALCRF